MSVKVERAFILGAGFGTRLRPYTDHCPKPMVQVAGRSLIWRSLDKLKDAGISEVVVNTHYMADLLEQHLNQYDQDLIIHAVREEVILDTGGGVKNALHYFKDDPFFVIAGDNLWTDGHIAALTRLMQHWDDTSMDILTLMHPIERMTLTHGVGDYNLCDDGKVRRSKDKSGTHMWTNIRLNSPHIYRDYPSNEFSFLNIMDDCERKGRFFALEHDGDWHHISTPADLENVNEQFCAA
ncbi:MAG: nucleotidyltransferase family protein [Alphaproteobacteria bacterium]